MKKLQILGTGCSKCKRLTERNSGYYSFDIGHNLNAAVTYQTRGIRENSFLTAITRDWAVDTMFRARTAFPTNVIINTAFPGKLGIPKNYR